MNTETKARPSTPDWVLRKAQEASKSAFKACDPIMSTIPNEHAVGAIVALTASFHQSMLISIRQIFGLEAALLICDAVHQGTRDELNFRPMMPEEGR